MTKSVCCDHGKIFFIYTLFYINFLQVFSIKFAVNLFSRHLVYFSGTTMEIRVTRPFIVSFIPGDQYGGPDCFISCLHVLFTEINQNQSPSTFPERCQNTGIIECSTCLVTTSVGTTFYLYFPISMFLMQEMVTQSR